MAFKPAVVKIGLQHLQSADPVLAAVIQQVGAFGLRPDRDRFGMLVRSIISQQISGKAARSIRERLASLVAPEMIAPDSLLRFSVTELRSVGLSLQKATYLHDLAERVESGAVNLSRISRRDDDAVIEELVQVKGIGVWTAQMFLMFSLGRLDVFPHADLGIRSALRNLYGLDELPDKVVSHEIARPWRPYATIASWYCWRSLEIKPG